MVEIKLAILRRLYLWWINEDDGRFLRGTGKLEPIEDVLFEMNK